MSAIEVSHSAVINAPSARLYHIFADYVNEHPRILPEAYFKALEVKQGGFGAGTRFSVTAEAFGQLHTAHMEVTEPRPGLLLAETDIDTGSRTTFAFQTLDEGRTSVTITINWNPSPGLRGAAERALLPRHFRGMLDAELEKLARYVAVAR